MSQTRLLHDWLRPAVYIILAVAIWSGSPSQAEPPSLRKTTTVKAIQRAEPAVVNIEGNKPSSPADGSGAVSQVNGMGAGVIIDDRGYILTNQHVIQDVSRIEVTLHSGRQHVGRLIARDPETDLALIKIDGQDAFPVIACGTSSDLMRGEPVIAIGNPFGYHHTVTEGIISALHRDIPVNGEREYPDLIQTDASINPGNSGGPLLNADGLMIGINAAVRIGAQGIGFAIPIDRASEVAADMIAEHRRTRFDSPLRVKTEILDGRSRVRVVGGETSECRQGDIVLALGGRPVASRLEYELALVRLASESQVPIKLDRDGKQLETKLQLLGHFSSSGARLVSASSSSIKTRTYQELGLRMEPANPSQVRRIDPSYKGGLRITAVRKYSPADSAELRPGDILVGLQEWQTSDWNNLEWIMNNKMPAAESPKFHIMRGNAVFWGNFELSR